MSNTARHYISVDPLAKAITVTFQNASGERKDIQASVVRVSGHNTNIDVHQTIIGAAERYARDVSKSLGVESISALKRDAGINFGHVIDPHTVTAVVIGKSTINPDLPRVIVDQHRPLRPSSFVKVTEDVREIMPELIASQ